MHLRGVYRNALTLPLWHADAVQYAFDNRIRGNAIRLGFEAQYQSVSQDIRRHSLDILGANVVAAREPGVGPRAPVNTHAGPGACAVLNLPFEGIVDDTRVAGRNHDIDDVLLEFIRKMQIEDRLACLHDRGFCQKLWRRECVALTGLRLIAIQNQNPSFVFDRRITDNDV